MSVRLPAVVALIVGNLLGCAFVGGGVDGFVRDETTGAPVPGVTVSAEGTTATAITDGTGAYALRGVGAGSWPLVARRDGWASGAARVVDVARFGMTPGPDLAVLPLPASPGAHAATPAGLVALPQVRETNFVVMPAGRVFALPDEVVPALPALPSPVDLFVDPGPNPPQLVELQVAPLTRRYAVTFLDTPYPTRWAVGTNGASVTTTDVAPGVTRLRATLSEGRYAVRRRHPEGTEDSYYLFEVKGGAAPLASPPTGLELDALVNAVAADVNGLRTAVLAYDAAFDVYPAAGPTPRDLEDLDATPVPWPTGTTFDTLGWRPSGPTAASFAVEPTWDGFLVTGVIDADGDGVPAVIRATALDLPMRYTPPEVY